MQRALYALAVLSLVMAGCGPGGGATPAIGRAAPDFRLDTLTHERFYLNAQRGRVVVLIFWMTTCTICKQEMLEFKAVAEELEPDGVTVASVCTDPENLDAVRHVVDLLGLPFPTLLDHSGRVARRYGVRAWPTTVIIDRGGTLSLWRVGYNDLIARQLRNHLSRLAKEGGSN